MPKKPNLSALTERVLVVSLSHITSAENEILAAHQGDLEKEPQTILEYRFGYLVSAWHHYNQREPVEVAKFETDLKVLGLSKNYIALVRMAAHADCRWLQLDRDADVVPGLPVFEW